MTASQSPIKVSPQTKDRVRYLAALTDSTQAQLVDRAIEEYAVRHADLIEKGIANARAVLAGGDAAIAAHLLNVPEDAVRRVVGGRSARASERRSARPPTTAHPR
jgi:predicted transcriptional regulator